MQVISSRTGREHTVSGLRIRYSPPGDLLVLSENQMIAIPEAISDGNVLSEEAETRLLELGLINTLFDDQTVADLYDQRTTDMECDFLEELLSFAKQPVHRLLDVGCGIGRLLVPMTLRGYQVDGIDVSPTAILSLRNRLRELNTSATLVIGDIARTSIVTEYDFAFSAMNTVRYVGNRARFISHLNHIYQSLGPEGIYAFNMSFSVKHIQGKASWVANNIEYVWESGYEDVVNHQIDEVVVAKRKDGVNLHREIQLQYTPPFTTVTDLLNSSGWIVESVYSNVGTKIDDWQSHALDHGSRWIVCRKAA